MDLQDIVLPGGSSGDQPPDRLAYATVPSAAAVDAASSREELYDSNGLRFYFRK